MLNSFKKIIAIGVVISNCLVQTIFASTVVTTSDNAESIIYSHLQNRDEEFSFNYNGDNVVDVFDESYKSDDYMERSISRYEIYKKGSEIIFYIDYRTTKEQEDYINSQLSSIVYNLIDMKMSDIEKVKTINNYLVKIYHYDYSLKSDNPYTGLTTKGATCQAYAMTAYRMFKLAGIECRIVTGTLDGGPHGWNLVKVNGNYYHIDITNNDSVVRDKYFLVTDSFLRSNGFVWDETKFNRAPANYYDHSTQFIDNNNNKETDIDASYNGGYWYKKDNSFYFRRGSGVDAVGWFENNGNWYYLGNNGKMQTGWINDGGNWYYCWSNGQMATDTVVDGYKLSSTGAWIN